MKNHVLSFGLVIVAAVFVGCSALAPFTPRADLSAARNFLILNDGGDAPPLSENCYIRNWQLLGPFSFADKSYKSEWGSQEALDEIFVSNEAVLRAAPEGTECVGKEWLSHASSETQPGGMIDLDKVYGYPDYSVAYLAANVYCPGPADGYTLLFGSDDYIKVWLNDELVHTYRESRRSCTADTDRVEDICLKPGWNTLTIKCVDVVRGWEVLCRIADAEGNPVRVSDTSATE